MTAERSNLSWAVALVRGPAVSSLVRYVGAALLVTLGTGCAGASTTVVADDAQYPISLSRAVRDADGRIVSLDRTKKVGALAHESTAWSTLYSAIKLTPRTDISQAVNAQVAAGGGDAIVNVRIKSQHCAADWFAGFTTLPFWPGCMNIVVEGDIIKVVPLSNHRPVASAFGVRFANLEAVR